MSGLSAIIERELRAYFFSPLAYAVLTAFLFVNGAVFLLILSFFNDPSQAPTVAPLKVFFGDTWIFWLVLLVITPLLTMRLISEELRSGTIEPLMTAPVSETQVVVGKYLAVLAFYAALWLPTLVYVLIVARYSQVDWGPIWSGYLGILLIGGLFLAIGLLGSAFTKSQIMAASATFAMLLLFLLVSFLEPLLADEGWKELLRYVSLPRHMNDFSSGIVDTRAVAFYLSVIGFLLFLASRMLAAKKWR